MNTQGFGGGAGAGADLNVAYIGLNSNDSRTKCCGAQFAPQYLMHLPNGKTVDISAIRAAIERNSMLKTMNIHNRLNVWDEVGLTKAEYSYVLKQFRNKK